MLACASAFTGLVMLCVGVHMRGRAHACVWACTCMCVGVRMHVCMKPKFTGSLYLLRYWQVRVVWFKSVWAVWGCSDGSLLCSCEVTYQSVPLPFLSLAQL